MANRKKQIIEVKHNISPSVYNYGVEDAVYFNAWGYKFYGEDRAYGAMSADEARTLGEQLIKLADEHDAFKPKEPKVSELEAGTIFEWHENSRPDQKPRYVRVGTDKAVELVTGYTIRDIDTIFPPKYGTFTVVYP